MKTRTRTRMKKWMKDAVELKEVRVGIENREPGMTSHWHLGGLVFWP
jgi:hypothetical protein